MTILIHHAREGQWCIEDRNSPVNKFLDCYSTKAEAVKKARNKWAAPNQPIRVVGPNPEVIRQGEPSAFPSRFGV